MAAAPHLTPHSACAAISCGTLNSSSRAAGEVSLSGSAGYRYRLRVDFVHNDKTNLANDSSWFYFAVTK